MAGLKEQGKGEGDAARASGPFPSIMERLKQETRAQHVQVEQTFALNGRLKSVATYAELLGRLLGFYKPLEAKLAQTLTPAHGEVVAERLIKSSLLAGDLRALGIADDAIAALPESDDLPNVGTLARAWGAIYVLEGATLGGQIVRREVQERLQLPAGVGCRFFGGYGDRTGPMWVRFGQMVTSLTSAHPEEADAVVAAARETFTAFDRWLAMPQR